ncbi:MAG: hypothetical protein RL186_523 [Pseudomonadota bacterium]|jgi:uncharacterized membrane protein YdjX (TVP38/TMEM64 family)
MFARLLRFFTEMDSSATRAMWIAFVVFALAGLVLTFGMVFIDLDQSGVAQFLRYLRSQWWAPAGVTATFVFLAFIGAPQVMLIAATCAVFGPTEGCALSWLATMVSGTIGYGLGRIGGAQLLSSMLAGRGARFIGFLGRNGFLASLIIRLVPSGPFIICNMALGAAHVTVAGFVLGTGLGILPKIILVGFGAHGLGEALAGNNRNAIWLFLAAALIWAAIAFILRPLLARIRNGREVG